MGSEDEADGDGERGDKADLTGKAPNARRLAESIDEVLNGKNIRAIDRYHHEDLEYYRSSGEAVGREGLKDNVEMFLDAFPDLEATVHDVFADGGNGDQVVLHYSISGTHAGTFEAIPPTDEQIEVQGISMAEFDGEKVTTFDLVFDNLGMLEDLGLIK